MIIIVIVIVSGDEFRIRQVLTPEIKTRLEEIEVEFSGRLQSVNDNIAALEEEIKNDVLKQGTSVRGTFMRAVWNKGRVTRDTKRTESYASAHPEILKFRKQGVPFVSFYKVDK